MKTIVKNPDYQNLKFFQMGLNRILTFSMILLFLVGCSCDKKKDTTPQQPDKPIAEVSIVANDLNVTITDPLTALSFEITSKYNIKTFQVKINNIDRAELVTLTDNILEIKPTPTATLPSDYLIIILTITDENDNTYTETFNFTVDFDITIAAAFSAAPQVGYAPTEVTFTPKVSAEESIQLYHWDFGDGTKNDSDTNRENLIGSPVTHTYLEAGDYKVILTIYDSKNQPATSELIVKIVNQPPVVTRVEVSPSNGELPLEAWFSATATDNEGIEKFLWDFDGDGVIDYTDSEIDSSYNQYANSSYTYTYETTGIYQATLSVSDTNGETTIVAIPTISVIVGPEGTPSVTAYAYPSSGQAPLTISFSASYGSFAKWEWDIDGDGIFDYSSNETGDVEHIYTQSGTYFAKLQVTEQNGFKSSDNIEITVDQYISLTKNTDTIDIKQAEIAELTVLVAGETETSLIIENDRYEPIITLLDWQQRSGTFSASWDGTDGTGSIAPQGAYYAVLLYKENGASKRFDLRDERVNRDIAIETNISQGQTFAPFLSPLSIEFELTEAAEVSLDIGPDGISVTERIKTLLQKHAMGKGVYKLEWAGDANDGTVADLSLFQDKYPGDANYYMTGGFKNILADNAIFVKNGVSVLNLRSDAPVFVPNAIGDDGKRNKLAISFELTAAASATLSINDAGSGAIIMTKEYNSLEEGEQIIYWDGKNNDGKYIAPGAYRLGIKAKDSYGYTSLTQYALQRIFY